MCLAYSARLLGSGGRGPARACLGFAALVPGGESSGFGGWAAGTFLRPAGTQRPPQHPCCCRLAAAQPLDSRGEEDLQVRRSAHSRRRYKGEPPHSQNGGSILAWTAKPAVDMRFVQAQKKLRQQDRMCGLRGRPPAGSARSAATRAQTGPGPRDAAPQSQCFRIQASARPPEPKYEPRRRQRAKRRH